MIQRRVPGRWLARATDAYLKRTGDDRSVKIKSLEASKLMKIKWLVLCCIEADFCRRSRLSHLSLVQQQQQQHNNNRSELGMLVFKIFGGPKKVEDATPFSKIGQLSLLLRGVVCPA